MTNVINLMLYERVVSVWIVASLESDACSGCLWMTGNKDEAYLSWPLSVHQQLTINN